MTAPVPLSEQIAAVLDVAGPNDTALQAVVRTLRLFERYEPQARLFFGGLIEKEKLRQRQAQHPTVKMVLDAFDGEIKDAAE
jgi:hypothetical protein